MTRPRCRITREPIDTEALMRDVASESDGAIVLFVGVVRDHHGGRAVANLEYDSYAEMAELELARIVEETRSRWAIGDIAVEHRVGLLEIGDASVAIAVASPHRAEAYEASRFVIEELKRRVPIWKREGYVDGERRWIGVNEEAVPGSQVPG
jgi:molybdopterin synthase catalytic subunit